MKSGTAQSAGEDAGGVATGVAAGGADGGVLLPALVRVTDCWSGTSIVIVLPDIVAVNAADVLAFAQEPGS